MPIGQVIGAHWMLEHGFDFVEHSMGSRPSRSSLLMKVTMGVSRRRQTEQLDGLRFDAVGRVDDHHRQRRPR